MAVKMGYFFMLWRFGTYSNEWAYALNFRLFGPILKLPRRYGGAAKIQSCYPVSNS